MDRTHAEAIDRWPERHPIRAVALAAVLGLIFCAGVPAMIHAATGQDRCDARAEHSGRDMQWAFWTGCRENRS